MRLGELATRVGITLANLSNIKTGKAKAIRFSTLEAICRELECTPGDILDSGGEVVAVVNGNGDIVGG
jgi:putative transcriptional regulator